jgi:hypothetical protein
VWERELWFKVSKDKIEMILEKGSQDSPNQHSRHHQGSPR